jgi:hypothetical protein
VLWTHTCNPSYSGGRDQEDHSSKPTWANSSRDPISKKPNTKKRAGGVAEGVGPEFCTLSTGKKKKKKTSNQKKKFQREATHPFQGAGESKR